MAHWDSYGYPEHAPKAWISFGPQRDGSPQLAWIGAYDEGEFERQVGYQEEYRGPWPNESAAKAELNAKAEEFIHRKKL